MPTIVGILTFMSRINFSLNLAEHEKSFITSGPELGTCETEFCLHVCLVVCLWVKSCFLSHLLISPFHLSEIVLIGI